MIKRNQQLKEDGPPSESQTLLRLSPTHSVAYSSLADQAEQPIDYETLLTLALESTSREAARKSKRKQGILISVLFFLLIMMGILLTYSVEEYPEEKHLHDEIDSLESDIKQMEKETEVDAIRRDIEDKKNHLLALDNDSDIDDDTRAKMIEDTQEDIDELNKLILELKNNEDEGGKHLLRH